jgi:hypothetical protein
VFDVDVVAAVIANVTVSVMTKSVVMHSQKRTCTPAHTSVAYASVIQLERSMYLVYTKNDVY